MELIVITWILCVLVMTDGCCVGRVGHGDSAACPRIISRAEWGARPPTEESSHLPDLLPMLFVHHSAMAECEDQEACSQAVRDIQDLHMDGNGWWDIGYSFLIGGDCNIYEGRGWNIQGAHTGGFNTEGYGVCFMGNFMDHNPSTGAIAAYHSLASCMVEEEKISREYQMYGHRQTKPPGATECPGDVLYATIQEWEGWTEGNISELKQ
eukprot:GFUD01073838.1.p1 GENE.GFUD01073838.1~~GFUD01073838.1.p1  ORF type:complete len:209 (+),score=54.63 GFUD01073838.1:58-684(+)